MLFNGCLRSPFQSGQPECATGDTASTTTVALVGDSHAAMWNPAFQQIATQRRWRLEMLAKGACPLMDLPITNHLFSGLVEHFEHCDQWRGQILARLRDEHPRLIVMGLWRGYGAGSGNGWLSGFTSYDPAWIDSLTRLVQQLRGTGAKVLVLGPTPDPHTYVPICLSGHLDNATACSPPRSRAVNEAGIAAESAATKAGGGQYTDLTKLFCTTNRCPVVVGNTMVYIDDEHMTLDYSRQLAPVIGALADRALAPVDMLQIVVADLAKPQSEKVCRNRASHWGNHSREEPEASAFVNIRAHHWRGRIHWVRALAPSRHSGL